MSQVHAPHRRRMKTIPRELAAESTPAGPQPRQSPRRAEEKTVPWHRTAFALSLTSGLLLWAAFPPLNFAVLAWLAPVGWLALVRGEALPGRRPYVGVWLAGFLHWLVLLQFVRLPHWAAYGGWVALSLYLSIYPLLFVGLSRVAVHRLRIPLLLAAPAIWTGLELIRSYLFTGFAIALLGHTQVSFPAMIQMADLCGAYGISFLVMFGAACLASMLPLRDRRSPLVGRWTLWPAAALAGAVVACLAYGGYRLYETPPGASDERQLRVALVQGCFETRFENDYDVAEKSAQQNFADYLGDTVKICRENPGLDLVVWPESMFLANEPDVQISGEPAPPPNVDAELYAERAKALRELFHKKAGYAARQINKAGRTTDWIGHTHLLAGCASFELGPHPTRHYNSALLIDPEGTVEARYYKMHCVMFGEYVPLGDLFPWIYKLTPMSEGLTPGRMPQEFQVAGLRLAPSICFESTVPHLIRRQLRELRHENATPDILVNVTNDGWFWGSNALDLHLTCGIFRAVEQRKPLLIAANTGFSAVINGNGRVEKKGRRFDSDALVAEVRPDGRHSLYQTIGDLPSWGCSLFVCFAALAGCCRRRRMSA